MNVPQSGQVVNARLCVSPHTGQSSRHVSLMVVLRDAVLVGTSPTVALVRLMDAAARPARDW
jgi:hypothetical protein